MKWKKKSLFVFVPLTDSCPPWVTFDSAHLQVVQSVSKWYILHKWDGCVSGDLGRSSTNGKVGGLIICKWQDLGQVRYSTVNISEENPEIIDGNSRNRHFTRYTLLWVLHVWGLNAAVETGHLDPSDAPCYVTATICARCVAVCYTRVSAEQSARGTRECACRAQQHPASCPKTDARAGSAQLGWSELSGTYFLCDCVCLAVPAGWCRMQAGWVWICVWRVDTVPVSSTLLLLLCIPNGNVAHYCPVLQSPQVPASLRTDEQDGCCPL